MMKTETLIRIDRHKIIAIVRGAEPEHCMDVAGALLRGGIRLMEITYDQARPESWKATAGAIREIARAYDGELTVGAGTVTTPGLAELTADAGGRFVISPDTDVRVIRRSVELGLVSMPGAMTASEIKTAHEAGADYVKLFPAGCLGPGYLRAVRAPLNHVRLMAVGGINEKNLGDFLRAGAVGAGIGGNLANRDWIARGEFEKITETARVLVRIAEEFQNE
ncbi:MAG: bifunctional 4-hydroxy-2-oxoglutarate aldolase/2-dehydro-3-deoxy-phosphogluconate aldolase [Oscillospiraceae bacterium]|nr:bifunctional 4-hydroxy-2-oxoglutarate aldolase/2-dehydro-3-deoxy-phosphogluconate aldolase [Oscillospiraceae bacterium]